jgi:hypothetical protein
MSIRPAILARIASAAFMLSSHPQGARAQDARTEQAVKLIIETADKICQSVPLEQSSNGWQLSGDAKAKVGGLIGKFTDLGIAGAGKYDTGSSRGVLQKDLADSIKNGNDCRLHVFNVLSQHLLGPAPIAEPLPPAPAPKPSGAVFIVTRNTALRRTPNPYGDTVEDLSAGTKVVVLTQTPRDDGWTRIRSQDTKEEGFINESDLMRVSP